MSVRPCSDVVHRHLVPWLQEDWPLKWSKIFQREAPLVLEIGFGNGVFLIDQAQQKPDANCVGIERSWEWIHHLATRIHDVGLEHVRLIQGEAQVALHRLFGSNTIQELFINFPDPWPKQQHYARRLIQTELVAIAQDRLAPGGHVTVATDHPGYAAWIASILEGQTILRSWFETTSVHALAGRLPTKYEQRARRAHLDIYYFVWYKPGRSSPTTRPQKRHAMPYIVLEGVYDLDQTLRACPPKTWREGQQAVEVSITLIRTYRELSADAWLVEVMVKEDNLSQHIGIAIIVRSPTQLLLKLSAMGFPRPTWGVQRAVWHMAEMLQEYNPRLRVIWMSMAASQNAEEAGERPRRHGARRHPPMAPGT